jgi:hypothetical protein
MKRIFVIILAASLGMMLTFNSCKKYEDGPTFSLASAKSRVVNKWKIEKVLAFGFDVTALFTGFTMEFKSDFTYTITYTGVSTSETGAWRFDATKENIYTKPDNSVIETKWEILRLKSDELWVNYSDGTNLYEIHLVSQ